MIKRSNDRQCITISFHNTVQYESIKQALDECYYSHTEKQTGKDGANVENITKAPALATNLYHTKIRWYKVQLRLMTFWLVVEFNLLQESATRTEITAHLHQSTRHNNSSSCRRLSRQHA